MAVQRIGGNSIELMGSLMAGSIVARLYCAERSLGIGIGIANPACQRATAFVKHQTKAIVSSITMQQLSLYVIGRVHEVEHRAAIFQLMIKLFIENIG